MWHPLNVLRKYLKVKYENILKIPKNQNIDNSVIKQKCW